MLGGLKTASVDAFKFGSIALGFVAVEQLLATWSITEPIKEVGAGLAVSSAIAPACEY
jgi:hypothetical protein